MCESLVRQAGRHRVWGSGHIRDAWSSGRSHRLTSAELTIHVKSLQEQTCLLPHSAGNILTDIRGGIPAWEQHLAQLIHLCFDGRYGKLSVNPHMRFEILAMELSVEGGETVFQSQKRAKPADHHSCGEV